MLLFCLHFRSKKKKNHKSFICDTFLKLDSSQKERNDLLHRSLFKNKAKTIADDSRHTCAVSSLPHLSGRVFCASRATCDISAVITSLLCSHTPSGWPLWPRLVMSVCSWSQHHLEYAAGKLHDPSAIRLVVISRASARSQRVRFSYLCGVIEQSCSVGSRLPRRYRWPLSKRSSKRTFSVFTVIRSI